MVKKLCPNCQNYSYSAYAEGKWVCPNCSTDLTAEEVLLLEESDLIGQEEIQY